MDCNTFKIQYIELFDKDTDQQLASQLRQHIAECSECAQLMSEMEETISILKPRVQPQAPFLLKQNIMNSLSKEEKNMKTTQSKTIRFSPGVKRILGIAAAVALLVVAIPFVWKHNSYSEVKAASSIFDETIEATQSLQSMIIKLNVRTVAHDNFDLVGTNYTMVEHTITKSFEKPEKWRVDKGERIVICDGTSQYLWMPKFQVIYPGPLKSNFVEWFRILLNPGEIFAKEKVNIADPDSKVMLTELDNEIRMTISSKAKGNFINDYCKNKSISESDNRREYVFDAKSKLLKSLKIYVLEGAKETLIVETTSISFNCPVDKALFVVVQPQPEVRTAIKPANEQPQKNSLPTKTGQVDAAKPHSVNENPIEPEAIQEPKPTAVNPVVENVSAENKTAKLSPTIEKNTELIEIPKDYKGRGYVGIEPKEVVTKVFECIAKDDWDCFERAWVIHLNAVILKIIKSKYSGLTLLSVGEPFQSGTYRGYYVPIEAKLKNGTIWKKNIPVRNDNKEKSWVIDGGF